MEITKAEHLPFDLSEESNEIAHIKNFTFSVIISGKVVLDKLHIMGWYSEYRAVKIKAQINVEEIESLIIDFKKDCW